MRLIIWLNSGISSTIGLLVAQDARKKFWTRYLSTSICKKRKIL